MSENEKKVVKGGAGRIYGEQVEVQGGGAAVISGKEVEIHGGGALAISASDTMKIYGGGGTFLAAGNTMQLYGGGGAVLAAGDKVLMEKSNVLFAISPKVELHEGSRVVFNLPAAAAFGAALGLVLALFRRRK